VRRFTTLHKEEKMADRRIPVHLIITGVYFLGALVTLIPMETADKTCLLGYKAVCSFSPISTLVLLALGGLHIFLQSQKSAEKELSKGVD